MRTIRSVYALISIVLLIGLIVVMVRSGAWWVLVVTVGMLVALLALLLHDRRAAARFGRDEHDPKA